MRVICGGVAVPVEMAPNSPADPFEGNGFRWVSASPPVAGSVLSLLGYMGIICSQRPASYALRRPLAVKLPPSHAKAKDTKTPNKKHPMLKHGSLVACTPR